MLPVILELGPLRIYGYGLAIAVGMIWGFRMLWLRRREMGLKDDETYWALVNGLLLSGFGGGHLLYLLQYARTPDEFAAAALNLSSGYSVLGGFFGVTLFLAAFARWKKLAFLRVADSVYFTAAFAHMFGRIGCFLAGCCWGKPTGLPWSAAFTNPRSMVPPELLGVRLHPVQLYEAAADGALAYVWWRVLRATDAGRLRPGAVVIGHMAAYGLLRFGLEFVRGDALPSMGGLTQGQWLGLALAASGGAVWIGREKCTRSC